MLRRRAWTAASVVAAVVVLAPIVPWYLPPGGRADETAAPGLRLLVANVYYRNYQHEKLIRLVREERPDVVGLVEVTSHWLRKLDALKADYPYRIAIADEAYAGIAILSRQPLGDARALDIGGTGLPAATATVATARGPVDIVIVHPSSPVNGYYFRQRNRQVRALADFARQAARPLVIAGDLNLTMWNRHYRPLTDVGKLHNARAGHGVAATWPSGWPLGVPIDHILGNDRVRLQDFRVLSAIGSDHRPIEAEFATR